MGTIRQFGPDEDAQYAAWVADHDPDTHPASAPLIGGKPALPCRCTNRGDDRCTLGGALLPWCCPVCTGHRRADGTCRNDCGTAAARAFRAPAAVGQAAPGQG